MSSAPKGKPYLTEYKGQEALFRESEGLPGISKTAAVLCHEIAAPLTIMYSTVEHMEHRLNLGGDAEELKHLIGCGLQDLKSEISRLAALLNDFRSLSCPTTPNSLPIDIGSFIMEWIKVIAAEAESRGVYLDYHISSDFPLISLDREKMKQVFLNLCKNALEAMPGGGRLSIGARYDQEEIVVEISDTGIGVPEGVNIFEPFTTTKPDGSGLGLAVVRQIVHSHGGKITYTSRPGAGSSFYLTFPRK